MKNTARFDEEVIAALREGKILGIRAGTRPHRFIGIWVVVVEGRAFVRSWSLTAGGWCRTFLKEPTGVISIDGREVPVRALRTRSERLQGLISKAYQAKYSTPGSVQYVRDLSRGKCRATTMELVPLVAVAPRSPARRHLASQSRRGPAARS